MGGQLGQIVFIVWRESIEALLVVGILQAWLSHRGDPGTMRKARAFLWGGVVAGLAAAGLLAVVILAFGEALPDEAQDYFHIAMVLVATGLILQMVVWMRRHGRTLKRDLESGMDAAAGRANWWMLFTLTLLAVAREGSETVVFLYGALAAGSGAGRCASALAGAAGLALALGSYGLLQFGGRHLSWRLFFRVTELMLLFLAAALLMTGVDRLIGLGLLPPLSAPLWDTSRLLPDSGPFGGLVAALTGYRARPELLPVLVYAAYWLLVWLCLGPRRRPHGSPQTTAEPRLAP